VRSCQLRQPAPIRAEFQRSIELFEFLKHVENPSSAAIGMAFYKYGEIAARDAALSLYHFGCSLNAMRKQIPASASHAGKVDALKVRNARKQFQSDFPHIDNVRHGVAHAGELYETPEKMKANQPTERRGATFLIAEFSPSHYGVSIHGTLFTVQLEAGSITKLQNVRRCRFRAPSPTLGYRHSCR
jgi:hypothetical protein